MGRRQSTAAAIGPPNNAPSRVTLSPNGVGRRYTAAAAAA